MSRPRSRPRAAVGAFAALLCLAALGATPARANYYRNFISPTQYAAGFTQMPDIDQRWDALPSNGRMYCVPTTAFNLMAYIGQHGYPMIRPGAEPRSYWHGAGSASEIVADLSLMGVLMNTDAALGTGANGALFGLNLWLALTASNGLFTLHDYRIGTENFPSFDAIAAWVNMGVPVMAAVGWYDDDGVTITRDGGHVFTVVAVDRLGDQRTLTFHDPADEGNDLLLQSAVLERTYAVERRFRLRNGAPMWIDAVAGYGTAYLDGFVAIRPIFGVMPAPDALSIVKVQPFGFDLDPNPVLDTIASPLGLAIADLVMSPDAPSTFVVTRPGRTTSSRLWRFDHLTREWVDLAAFEDAQAVEVDRNGRIYVLDGRTLRCLLPDADDRWTENASVTIPVPCDGLALDDVSDRVLVLGDGSVRPFDVRTLEAQPEIRVPEGLLTGTDPTIAVSPEDGAIHLTDSLAPAVYRLDGAGGYEEIGRGALLRPRNLSVGDGGCVYVVDGASGLMKVFCPDPSTGDFAERPDLPFAGIAASAGIKIARSTSNFDPSLHTGPPFRNVLPPDVVTAVGDDRAPGASTGRMTLVSAVPNPFNPRTSISMELPRPADVTLTVHDLRGRRVRTLHEGELPAGRHAFVWEGTDDEDRPAASGVYLVQLRSADGERQVIKVVLGK